jgi:hypothetical protein
MMTIPVSSVSNREGIRKRPALFRESLYSCVLIAFLILAACVLPVSAADTPTVTITEYKVSPSVLMPDTLGTITITVKNTATSATLRENTGIITQDASTTKVTDINVNIENVKLEGNGITVLTNDFDRVGEIGPGQSIPLTFSIQAPSKSGMYFPEVWIDTTEELAPAPDPANVNTPVEIERWGHFNFRSSMTAGIRDEIRDIYHQQRRQTFAEDVIISTETGTVAPKNSMISSEYTCRRTEDHRPGITLR